MFYRVKERLNYLSNILRDTCKIIVLNNNALKAYMVKT